MNTSNLIRLLVLAAMLSQSAIIAASFAARPVQVNHFYQPMPWPNTDAPQPRRFSSDPVVRLA